MFNYEAVQDDEVTVKKGDIVDILEQETGQDGWWKIRCGDKEGLVPNNYLELIAEEGLLIKFLYIYINYHLIFHLVTSSKPSLAKPYNKVKVSTCILKYYNYKYILLFSFLVYSDYHLLNHLTNYLFI